MKTDDRTTDEMEALEQIRVLVQRFNPDPKLTGEFTEIGMEALRVPICLSDAVVGEIETMKAVAVACLVMADAAMVRVRQASEGRLK